MPGLLDPQYGIGSVQGLLAPYLNTGLLGAPLAAPMGGPRLRPYESRPGLAPYGIRHDGRGAKGLGYFGAIPAAQGYATELSSEDNVGEYPLLVPGLTRAEINHLTAGGEPTDEIYRKAEAYAAKRRAAGLNTFAQPNELRYPLPPY